MKLKEWWFNIKDLYSFHFELNLFNFIISINLLLFNFNIKTKLPYILNYWNSIYERTVRLTKNKSFEFQLTFQNDLRTGVEIYKKIHSDHTPFSFQISIFGLTIIFCVYDHRHWDEENDNYKEYGIM